MNSNSAMSARSPLKMPPYGVSTASSPKSRQGKKEVMVSMIVASVERNTGNDKPYTTTRAMRTMAASLKIHANVSKSPRKNA